MGSTAGPTIRRLLTAAEAASILGIRVHRCYELVRQDALPYVRLGNRQIRFHPGQLEEWIQAGGSRTED